MAGILSKVISSELDKAKRRIIKVLGKGKNDVRTPFHTSTPNTDAPPIENMRAVYMQTGTKGKSVVVGYINENLIAEPGEYRIFSTDSSGDEKNHIYIKGNGDIEIGGKEGDIKIGGKDKGDIEVGGNADNLIRYSKLDLALKDLDVQIQAELVKIATGISSAGGAYSPGTISTDISDSKIDEIKTS